MYFDERLATTPSLELASFGTPSDRYLCPTSDSEVSGVYRVLASLEDGTCLPCRGRDRVSDPWSYGVCTVARMRAYFLWADDVVESWGLAALGLRSLVHFALARPENVAVPTPLQPAPDRSRVVVLSHGYSPNVGPNYALMRALQGAALRAGWCAVVPNFVDSYAFGSSRGRSERSKRIFEELLCLPERPALLALVGHSQGGAASAVACTERVVRACGIRGLLMVGSESPHSGRDGAVAKPPVQVMRVMHALQDGVVPHTEMAVLGQRWGLPVASVDCGVRAGSTDAWSDDIHHDFLAKALLESVLAFLTEFLRDVALVAQQPQRPLAYWTSPDTAIAFDDADDAEHPGHCVVHVRSARGIGRGRIRSLRPVLLRFHLQGLEKLRLYNGTLRMHLECQSHGEMRVLQQLLNVDESRTPVDGPQSPHWCHVTRTPNVIQVALPAPLQPGPELEVDFVDMYR